MAMAHYPDIELIPNSRSRDGYFAHERDWRESSRHFRWLSIWTFGVCLVVGVLVVWLRPAVYESTAILHFSWPQPLGDELGNIAEEQIGLHARRLTSNRVLEALQSRLLEREGEALQLANIDAMVDAEAVPESRLIKLSASGNQRELLLPLVTLWVDTYLQAHNRERASDLEQGVSSVDDKIAALEQRIAAKRRQLSEFADANRIVSLERDENRILNNIKGIAKSLDAANEEKATAAATLASLREALAAGKVSVRPQDQASIDRLEESIIQLEERQRLLATQYTEEYMNIDPRIRSLRDQLAQARQKWDQRRRESQQNYVNEVEQQLAVAGAKVADLEAQLQSQQELAQEFNHKLIEMRAIDQELADLEAQAQQLKAQRVNLEVQQPYQARITLLEQPFVPRFPIGPDYWRDTGVVALASLLVALVVFLFQFVASGRRRPMVLVTPFPGSAAEQPLALQQGSRHPRLTAQGESDFEELPRDVILKLYESASAEGRLILGLILSGVAVHELGQLTGASIDPEKPAVILAGSFPRRVPVSDNLAASLRQRIPSDPAGSLWTQPSGQALKPEEMAVLIHQAGLDAGIDHPEQATLENVRFTYLAYLVRQGCRVNKLELIAGYVTPRETLALRSNAGGIPAKAVEGLQTIYPI